jgi:hypothetical protein
MAIEESPTKQYPSKSSRGSGDLCALRARHWLSLWLARSSDPDQVKACYMMRDAYWILPRRHSECSPGDNIIHNIEFSLPQCIYRHPARTNFISAQVVDFPRFVPLPGGSGISYTISLLRDFVQYAHAIRELRSLLQYLSRWKCRDSTALYSSGYPENHMAYGPDAPLISCI